MSLDLHKKPKGQELSSASKNCSKSPRVLAFFELDHKCHQNVSSSKKPSKPVSQDLVKQKIQLEDLESGCPENFLQDIASATHQEEENMMIGIGEVQESELMGII